MNVRKRILLFFACDILFNMAASFAHPVTPALINGLGLGKYMFGVMLAAMLTTNFLVSPFWGKLNDIVSSRLILIISCTGYAAGQWLFAHSVTELQFITVRAFTGIFTAGGFVAVLTYIVNTTTDDKKRAFYLTIHATIQSAAGAFGYFVGGMLGEISINAAIMAQVITLLLTGILFFIVCEKDSSIGSGKLSFSRIIKEANPFASFAAGKDFINSALVSVFILTVLQALSALAFDQSFNYYLKDVFDFSSGYNGLIKGITGILSLIINSTLILWMARKTIVRKSLALLFAVCGVIMTLSIIISDPIVFIVGNVAVYVLIMGSVPLTQNIVVNLSSKEHRNLTMGFYNSMKSLGSILGALAAGLLYVVNPKMPFIFGILACLAAIYVIINRRNVSADNA